MNDTKFKYICKDILQRVDSNDILSKYIHHNKVILLTNDGVNIIKWNDILPWTIQKRNAILINKYTTLTKNSQNKYIKVKNKIVISKYKLNERYFIEVILKNYQYTFLTPLTKLGFFKLTQKST